MMVVFQLVVGTFLVVIALLILVAVLLGVKEPDVIDGFVMGMGTIMFFQLLVWLSDEGN